MALSTQAANRKDLNTARDGVTMQHRHFAFVAGVIAKLDTRDTREKMAAFFADELANTNENFNRARFIAACKVEG